MTLQEQIKEQMKDAMRAKDSARVTTLRGLMSAFTNELVAQSKMPTDMLSDDEVIIVITRESKRRKDAIAQYVDAGREELAQDEKNELAILEEFLPELMSEDDILAYVTDKKNELGFDDPSKKGEFIGVVMGDLKGKADGAQVSKIINQLFQ